MVNKELFKNGLVVLLLTITIFSAFKYTSSLKEKYDLSRALNQIKEQVANLEKEKQNLLETLKKEKELQQEFAQENLELRDYLKASKNRLSGLFRQVEKKEEEITQLNSQISLLKAENTALTEQKNELRNNLNKASQEIDSLTARLSSMAALKEAMRELKKQMLKVGVEIQQRTQGDGKVVEGNRGFLIKDGQSTYPAKVKIEVIPVLQKEQ